MNMNNIIIIPVSYNDIKGVLAILVIHLIVQLNCVLILLSLALSLPLSLAAPLTYIKFSCAMQESDNGPFFLGADKRPSSSQLQ